jgi:Uma2 family endonuclease
MAKLLTKFTKLLINIYSYSWTLMQGKIGVRCPCGIGLDTVRIPDVVVIQQDDRQTLKEREAVIDFDLSAPLLVIEVISPFTKNVDYRAKRTEYASRDISEYWIVDPLEAKVSVLINSDGWYNVTDFFNSAYIISPTFPEFQLTPKTIFCKEPKIRAVNILIAAVHKTQQIILG